MKQLLSQDEIRDGVERLAVQVRDAYGQRPLTIVGILTGSLVMLADLIRHLDNPLRVALIRASQFRGEGNRRTALVIDDKLLPNLQGRDVLVVDDIFDTGHTLVEVVAQLALHHPASVRSAVLLRKTGRCEVAIEPDYVVFEIPDEFVVGYGLDHEDRYRNLPYVAALEPADLTRE
ncbi:MAG TPA: phosphoribosyltransferase family protein [Lacipirellulaceae bacterium]|jgi:hypoxanthine phosphoribosyltransferase